MNENGQTAFHFISSKLPSRNTIEANWKSLNVVKINIGNGLVSWNMSHMTNIVDKPLLIKFFFKSNGGIKRGISK